MAAVSGFGKLWELVGGVQGLVSAATTPRSGHTPVLLDPVDVITALAILVFRASGTKLAIDEQHRVYRDTPGMAQGAKRYYYGSNHCQHYDFAAPILYAVNWFNPHRNKEVQHVFTLALQGLELLCDSYSESPDIAQYLFNCHIRILKTGLAEHEASLNNEDYMIPTWDGNPIADKSKQVWSASDFEVLKMISAAFEAASKAKDKDQDPDGHIEYIKKLVTDNCEQVAEVRVALMSGMAVTLKKPAASVAELEVQLKAAQLAEEEAKTAAASTSSVSAGAAAGEREGHGRADAAAVVELSTSKPASEVEEGGEDSD